MMTVTDNSGGGQPVSLTNLTRGEGDLPTLRHPAVPRRRALRRERLAHQAARAGQADRTPREIAREMFELADDLLILTEGFVTYGGLAARDLEAMAQGFQEVLDDVVEAVGEVFATRERLRGLRIVEEPPVLRHFTARFAEV
jgi:tryptophanase